MNPVRGRILDLGSGAGRNSLHLQNLGHDVSASDNSPLAMEVVKCRGVQNSVIMPVTQVSSKLGISDTIDIIGNRFSLVSNKRRAKWMFRRSNKLTSGDARTVTTSFELHATEDPVHLVYHRGNRQRGRKTGQVRIRVRYRHNVGLWFDYLLTSRAEMEELINGSGCHFKRTIESDSPVYPAIIEKV